MEWQPIETAPKDGREIIVCDITAQLPESGAAFFKDGVWCSIDGCIWRSPTNWMPLPAPPTAKGE